MEAAGASSGARTLLKLPPGYHFAPTDEELIVHYLRRRINGFPQLLPIFKDVASLDSQRPEEVTAKFKDCGVDRWFFFTKRRRKYARGNRPNRMTSGNGFWKATGPQRMIRSGRGQGRRLVGRVRTLVFYSAPPTKETENKDMEGKAAALSEWKTSWTMYEYENLTSEEEAADKNVDKLGEWVLCTIQKQKEKNDDGPAAAKKVKEEVVKMEPKIEAGGKKRKGKTEAEDGADHQGPIFHPKPKKRSKVAVPTMPPPPHPAMASPEEGDEMMGMFVFENTGCPAGMSSPVPTAHQHHESPPPCSQTMSPPCVTDNHHYVPGGMACVQEPPRSAMTMSASAGGNYNIGSSGQIMMPTRFAGNTHSFHMPTPLLQQEAPPHMMSSLSGYSNHNVAPFMNNYLHPAHSAAAAYPGGYGYGGAARHNTAGQLGDYRYTGVDFPSFLDTSNSGISYADPSPAVWMNRGAVSSQSHGGYLAQSSSQMYHGGPSVPGPGTAMRPAAPLPWKDQVTART
uniref:Uncharacterized protein n=1 Tax=Avena sativa TaxID=4498 RepID=A0ACD5XLT7_AVESA